MPLPVVTVGHRFEGVCHACGDVPVMGEMITGQTDRCIEQKEICVTGSIGRGSCGHSCNAIGQSEVWFIDGLPVARLGDPVAGDIDGKLIEGSDFVNSD